MWAEPLHSVVLAIGHIDIPIRMDGNTMGESKFTWPIACFSPLANLLAMLVIFQDSGVAVSIGNVDVAVGGKGSVGGSAKFAGDRGGLAADVDF